MKLTALNLALIPLLSLNEFSCDDLLPSNSEDKWRFHQEIHVNEGYAGESDNALRGIDMSGYKTHENNYYGGASQTGTGAYRSTYERYKPYSGYEAGSATNYYRGTSDE